ncbi:MAG: MFS transporter [Deltaproteobacteria bacterium]|nr:MFS transporter [Deltaproteobacteria bacterium]
MKVAVQEPPAPTPPERIFTRDFTLTCLSCFFLFGSFNLLLPTIPLYAVQLGASEAQTGLVVGIFAFGSLLLRPFMGYLADRGSSKAMLLVGAAIFAVSSLSYLGASGLLVLLALRTFHGTGMSMYPTAANAIVAELAPPRRRGEAMGFYGLSYTMSMALGPALGMALLRGLDFPGLFTVSALTAVVGFALALPIATRRDPGLPGIPFRFYVPEALFPAAILFTYCFTFGAVGTYVPLFAVQQGVGNPGLFFTAYALSVLAIRTLAGRLSDRRGRAAVIVPGLALVVLGLAATAASTGLGTLLLGGVAYGLGFGMIHPALIAFTVDRTSSRERGTALATLSSAFELGIALGAWVMGGLVAWVGLRGTFWLSALFPLAGLIALLVRGRRWGL